jgi:RNA polymerase sigma-70 factor (ECF subfamily)
MVTLVDSPKTTSDQRFDEYVLPEFEVLFRTAWSLTRSHSDAQDLVQDTLLRAYRSIDRFDGRYPRAWLLTIMRNANINRVRKKKPDLLHDPELTFERSTDFADHEDPEHMVVSPVLDAAIENAFENLSDDFREVVELVDLDGLSYQEAATVLGVPVGTVMSRLHRARKRIRSHLEESGLESEVGAE